MVVEKVFKSNCRGIFMESLWVSQMEFEITHVKFCPTVFGSSVRHVFGGFNRCIQGQM